MINISRTKKVYSIYMLVDISLLLFGEKVVPGFSLIFHVTYKHTNTHTKLNLRDKYHATLH